MGTLGQIIFYSMITLIIIFATLIILILSLAFSKPLSDVMSSDTVPVANLGQDQLLSCYLKSTAVSQMSVTWTRAGDQGVVYQYKNGAAVLQDQIAEFRGRTQLFPDALISGNGSLLLRTVRPADEGEYTCSISSSKSGGKVNIRLKTAAFSAPTFTHASGVLTARASRWSPRPNLTWFSLDEVVLQGSTTFTQTSTQNSTPIYTVVSTLPSVNASGTYICRIQNDLVISVSKATITDTGVLDSTYFTFNAASYLQGSVSMRILAGVLFFSFLT